MARWAWAAVVWCVACGPTDPGSPPPPPGSCAPTTCDAEGKTCGEISDGCGGSLECGTCGEDQICSSANVCVSAEGCTPTTCAEAGKDCGALPDGCGGTLECGRCGDGQTCGGGGTPNVCGEGACTPTTCEAEGKNCGEISDGCGGTLRCGTCGDGQRCSDNVCTEAPQASRVKWFKQSTDRPSALAPDNHGGLLVAFGERVARFERGGAESWSLTSPEREVTYEDLEATPGGDRFFVGGEGPCMLCGGLIDSFSTTGDAWKRYSDYSGEVSRRDLTPDGRGGVAFIHYEHDNGDSSIEYQTASGDRRSFGPSSDYHEHAAVAFNALTRTPDGHAR